LCIRITEPIGQFIIGQGFGFLIGRRWRRCGHGWCIRGQGGSHNFARFDTLLRSLLIEPGKSICLIISSLYRSCRGRLGGSCWFVGF
jgi:hypothetical protein